MMLATFTACCQLTVNADMKKKITTRMPVITLSTLAQHIENNIDINFAIVRGLLRKKKSASWSDQLAVEKRTKYECSGLLCLVCCLKRKTKLWRRYPSRD